MDESPPSGRFGIAPSSIAKLVGLFDSTANIARVWIYGSRARGDHRNESDIDLAVDAPEMSETDFSRLSGQLDDLGLIYRVDLLRLQGVLDEGFRSRIERDNKIFWEPRRYAADAGELGGMELKPFQTEVLGQLAAYLDALAKEQVKANKAAEALRAAELDVGTETQDFPRKAWDSLRAAKRLPPAFAEHEHSSRFDGARHPIPNICFKIPTGGGKTLLASASIARTFSSYYRRHTGWCCGSRRTRRSTARPGRRLRTATIPTGRCSTSPVPAG